MINLSNWNSFKYIPKISAEILLYRLNKCESEVLLVHPGGSFWAKKDIAVWSIPKGEIKPEENLLQAAIRETEEETRIKANGKFIPLNPLKQKGGKIVHTWALKSNFEPHEIKSNSFEMEWPPRSSEIKKYLEADKAAWFRIEKVKKKIIPGQIPFISELENLVNQM